MPEQLTFEQHIRLVAEIRYGLMVRRWKVRDLAERTGYSNGAIYKLCNVKVSPSLECAVEVMRVLGISWEDLG